MTKNKKDFLALRDMDGERLAKEMADAIGDLPDDTNDDVYYALEDAIDNNKYKKGMFIDMTLDELNEYFGGKGDMAITPEVHYAMACIAEENERWNDMEYTIGEMLLQEK